MNVIHPPVDTDIKVQGTIAKYFWALLGAALIIVAIGIAGSLIMRGSVSFNKNAAKSAVQSYSADMK